MTMKGMQWDFHLHPERRRAPLRTTGACLAVAGGLGRAGSGWAATMGGRGRVMLTGLGRGIRDSAPAWASAGDGGFCTAGAAGYSGITRVISSWALSKCTRGEFLT